MGDFNWPNINWNTWETASNIEGKFVECLRKNFLIQHINTPTRVRGTDTPRVLDLVITDEYYIQNLIFESLLGKSDHSVVKLIII